MIRKHLAASLALSFALLLLLTCTGQQTPFQLQDASVNVIMANSSGHRDADTVTDTVENHVLVGMVGYLPSYISSVKVVIGTAADTDTTLTYLKATAWADTQWIRIAFHSIGTRTVTIHVALGATEKIVTATIMVVGRPVVISNQSTSFSVDPTGAALFFVTPRDTGKFSFQWVKDGSRITGANSDTLVIDTVLAANAGVYTCVVKDQWGDSAVSTPAVLTINASTNHKPQLSVTGVRNIVSAQACSLSLSTTDADSGQTFVYAMPRAPQGATLTANIFKWTPPATHLGTDTVVFTVTDNGKPPMSDTQTVYITVSSQITAPVKVSGIKVVSKVNEYFVLSWTKVGNADSYNVFRSADTINFQKIGSTSDSLYGDSMKTGNYYYYVVAVNTAGSSPASDIVWSGSINTKPQWKHSSISADVLEGGTITLSLPDSCANPDNNQITYTLAPGQPAKDTILAGVYSYTPSFTDSGSYTVKIAAWDNKAGDTPDTLTLKLHVTNVNQKPVFVTDTPSLSYKIDGGALLSFNISAVDPDNDAVSYFIRSSTLPRSLPVLTGKTVTWQSQTTDSVNASIVICATDGKDTATATVQVAVGKVNAAPSLASQLGAQTVAKGQTLRVNENDSLKLSFTVGDPDVGQLHVLKMADRTPLSCGSVVFDSVNYKFTFVPSFNCATKDSILIPNVTFIVTDNGTPPLSDTFKVNVTVVNVNRPPVIMALKDTSAYQGKILAFMVQSVDPDQDSVTLSATDISGAKLPDSASFNPKTGVFTWTPTFGQLGAYSIVFTATDGKAIVKDTVKITVVKTDRAPVFNAIASLVTGAEASTLKLYVKATDPDGDAVTITTVGTPFTKGATLAKDTLSWTPGYSDSGTYQVSFIASDGVLFDTATTTIKIANTDRPPVATAQSVNAGRNTAKTIILSATDPDLDPIAQFKITKVASNGTATLSDPVAGTVTYTPTTGFIGIDTFAFSASDGSLWSLTSANVIITVDSSKVAPKITTEPRTDTTINQGGTFTITVATNNAFPSPTYYWHHGAKGSDTLKSTTTNPTYSKGSVVAGDSGIYFVIVSNTSGSDTSGYAHLAVNVASIAPTGATATPASVCSGVSSSLSVTGGSLGTGASWKWYTDAGCTTPVTGTSTGATITVSPMSTATYYVRAEGTANNTATAAVALTVNSPPVMGTQPSAAPACVGSPASFVVAATGTGLTYQWQKGGTNISAGTNASAATATLTISSVASGDAATYMCVVSNGSGCSTTSSGAALTVNSAPAITSQPSAASACVGSPASFVVAATGTGLTYQWQKGGTNISAATNASAATATLTISSVASGDAATYMCVVSNGSGCSTTSSGAALTVNTLPAITTQPVATSVCAGTGNSASFAVAASGTAPLTYQWLKGGSAISSSTNPSAATATLNLTNVAAGDAVNYSCVVTNGCSSTGATSNNAALTVNSAPTITAQPAAASACVGSSASFAVAASGTAPLTYQWLKGGSPISSSTNPSAATTTLNLTNVAAGDAVNYSCVVTNGCSSTGATSSSAALTVNAPPAITGNILQTVTKNVGGSLTLSISASGSNLTYLWKKNGSAAPGTNNLPTYTNSGLTSADNGSTYQCLVTNGCGTGVTTNTATLAVLSALQAAGGGAHTLVLMSDSTVWACGSNLNGQLGDGTNSDRLIFTRVLGSDGTPLSHVQSVAAGDSFSLFLCNSGTVWSCGSNAHGQLGIGSNTDQNKATNLSYYTSAAAIGAGLNHAMVLQGLNYQYSMSSFGLNNHGQLGNGTYNGESSPVSVSDGRPTAIIHCGANFSLVGDFGGIDACGNNDYGQLGSAPNGDQPTPAMIFSGLVAAGRNFTLVVDGVGNLSGCGDNTYGQLGIVTYAPNRVTSLTAITTNVSTVATAPGGLFTLIQTTDGNIHGCGYNLYGQLGNGGTTTTYQLSLTNVTNVQTFAAGSNHSIFIDNLGRILTCGNNSNGQLGNGDATHANKTTPAVVSF